MGARNLRLIARLDIKGKNLIKTIQLEGLRIIGPPGEYALKYYDSGADELIFMDTVASLYGRNHLTEIIKKAAENIFVPITVGGGIRSVDDALKILRSGADKVAINTAAVLNPNLISEIATKFGSQCMVLSIEAKKISSSHWEVYTDGGREHSGLDVLEWANRAVELGAGEIFLTSVDKEGTKKGFDLDLMKTISQEVNVPLIASGGMGQLEDIKQLLKKSEVDAIAMASVLHYDIMTINEVRNFAKTNKLNVRDYE